MNNEKVRQKLNKWHEDNYKPELKRIASAIGIDNSYFIAFKTGKRTVSNDMLQKINRFIDTHSFN